MRTPLFLALLTNLLPLPTLAANLLLRLPLNLAPLPPTTHAILTPLSPSPSTSLPPIRHRHRLSTPVTRLNTFLFRNITSQHAGTWLLDIPCRDWDFGGYGVDITPQAHPGEEVEVEIELYRVGLGGVRMGEKMKVGGEGVEVRVVRGKEYYEARSGFSPMDLLKNPMILIAIVGLGFVFGMPYLLDNMDPEMKAEIEEQQKKSILRGGANAANPLQNFDMAAWMAGKTAGSVEQIEDEGSASGGGSGTKARKRG